MSVLQNSLSKAINAIGQHVLMVLSFVHSLHFIVLYSFTDEINEGID